jgi:hypothetical protein
LVEISWRIPSTNTLGSAAVVIAARSVVLCREVAFSDPLKDLDWGSWEGLLPESSSLGGDGTPLRGAFIRDSGTHYREDFINFVALATFSSPSTRGGVAHSGPPKWPIPSPPPTTLRVNLANPGSSEGPFRAKMARFGSAVHPGKNSPPPV